ncbi:MAG TPA: hypothetical protein VMB03_02100 [Bryobacteraceae bacterium]|nr:hypothetical protein [Bryobacteraceae bacterium]
MGTRGVGFLFAMIALFLLVVCLQTAGHATLARECGLAGGHTAGAIFGCAFVGPLAHRRK